MPTDATPQQAEARRPGVAGVWRMVRDAHAAWLADYAPSSGGGFAVAKPRIGHHLGLLVLFGFLGLPVIALVGMGLVAHTRSRRARARYLASRS